MEDRRATLRQALDALASICEKPAKRNGVIPERVAVPPSRAQTDPSVIQGSVDRLPPADPQEWREPFVRWLESACVRDLRCSGGVGCLHIAFCDWAIALDDVPCSRLIFECLLREREFVISDGLVSGLIFKDDFEAAGLRPLESD
jgi:hypothetical protein